VFQSCLSSPENDVLVQFLNNINTNEGVENMSMGNLDWEMVHGISFLPLQEGYEHEFVSIHSFESQNDSPQANFLRFNESELFDEQEDTHNIVAISFENILRNE
jgi:hypothetical protein